MTGSELHAKIEIAELMARYCFALDDERLADLAALFMPNGEWVSPAGSATGAEAIQTLLATLVPPRDSGPAQRHINTNIVIELAGSVARARSYFTLIRKSGGKPTILVVGSYWDEFVQHEGAWRFSRRQVERDLMSS